jgi:WD40 repeat protein
MASLIVWLAAALFGQLPVGADLYGDPLPPGAVARMGTLRLWQQDGLTHLAFSPEGKALVAWCGDAVLFWDLATGREIRRIALGDSGVDGQNLALALSPDGRLVATLGTRVRAALGNGPLPLQKGRDDGVEFELALRDAASGRVIRRFTEPDSPPAFAFSPDGRALATGGSPRTLRLWDLASGRPIREFGNAEEIRWISFAPDGRMIYTDADQGLDLWDVASGRRRTRTLPTDSPNPHTAFALSPDGKAVATAGDGNATRLWDIATGKAIVEYQADGFQDALAFSPDGKYLASLATISNVTHLWEAATGRMVRSLRHQESAVAAAFSPDSRTLAAGGGDHAIHLWDVGSGDERSPFPSHRTEVTSVAFSPDGRTLATGGEDGTARLWDAATGRPLHQLSWHPEEGVRSVGFAPDGRLLVSTEGSREDRLWDVGTGKGLPWLDDRLFLSDAAFSPDGKLLVALDRDAVQIWDIDGRRRLRRIAVEPGAWALAPSPDGKVVATWDGDMIRVWDAATGEELRQIPNKHDPWLASDGTRPLSFSPDGRLLAALGPDRTLSLWDVTTGRLRDRLHIIDPPVCPDTVIFKFSPDGRMLASFAFDPTFKGQHALSDRFIRLWDVASGEQIRRIEHPEGALAIAFSPDSHRLASAGADRSVRVWDVASGEEMGRFQHRDVVNAVAFSPDGRRLASGGEDAVAYVWDLGRDGR